MNTLKTLATGVVFGSLILSGCGSAPINGDFARLQAELDSEKSRADELMSSKSTLESTLSERDRKVDELLAKLSTADSMSSDLLPPQAKPGQCFARVFTPPVYQTTNKSVLAKEASESIRVTEPAYDNVQERVLVKEASTKLKVIPARYDWVEERMLVKEASERLEVIPAQYETIEEQLLVSPASTVWKKGRGPIEKINDMTGEIMCLVEVPAVYKTLRSQKLVSKPTTRTIAIPAEYKMVKKRIMVEAPRTEEIEIPAVYKNVKVRKMVVAAAEQRVAIPATYKNVSERHLVTEGQLEWQPILCETNTTTDTIRKLQNALATKGYNPGPIDGVVGRQTMRAVTRYQGDNSLPSGKLTIETLQRLNVLAAS